MGGAPKFGGHRIWILKLISLPEFGGDQIHWILPKTLNSWTLLPPLHLQATQLRHLSLLPVSFSHLQSSPGLTLVSPVLLIGLKIRFSKLCNPKQASRLVTLAVFYSTVFVLTEIIKFFEPKLASWPIFQTCEYHRTGMALILSQVSRQIPGQTIPGQTMWINFKPGWARRVRSGALFTHAWTKDNLISIAVSRACHMPSPFMGLPPLSIEVPCSHTACLKSLSASGHICLGGYALTRRDPVKVADS
jgi:hypothetical protein